MLGDHPPVPRAVITELADDHWWTRAAAAGALVFADVGWDGTEACDRAVLGRLTGCHSFMPNEVEAMAYTRTDTAAEALASGSDGYRSPSSPVGTRERSPSTIRPASGHLSLHWTCGRSIRPPAPGTCSVPLWSSARSRAGRLRYDSGSPR